MTPNEILVVKYMLQFLSESDFLNDSSFLLAEHKACSMMCLYNHDTNTVIFQMDLVVFLSYIPKLPAELQPIARAMVPENVRISV